MTDFNNKHLDNLWVKLVPHIAGTGSTSEIVKIVELFREFDMVLEDEAHDCKHWRTMYGNACKEIDQLKESIRLRERVIEKYRTTVDAIKKERDKYKSQYEDLCKFLGEWRNAKASDDFEDPQKLKELKDENASLKESLDIQKKSNDALLSANINLAREKRKLEDSLSYTMIQQLEAHVEELTEQLKDAEEEVENLKKKLDFQQNDIVRLCRDRDRKDEAIAKLAEIRDKLQRKVDDLKEELQVIRKDHGKLHEENRGLNARTDCLRLEVNWYRKHYREQSDKIRELKKQLEELTSQYQKLTIENKRLYTDELITRTLPQPWECSLEGTVKINGELLGKVCGVKIDDDK